MKSLQCPICHAIIDAGFVSRPGDWTCCAQCLQWLVYLKAWQLRPVTNAELLSLSPEERQQLKAWRERLKWAWHPRK